MSSSTCRRLHPVLLALAFPWLAASAATAATAATAAAQGQRSAARNVVFILSDDHRYDFMGFMERAPDFLETPAMDRMAAEGAHVQNAFVTTSLCSPSRASILTGQYAHRHGVVDNTSPIPPGTEFFPQYLQRAGYATAYMGKWHMGESEGSDQPRAGFDRWVSFRGQGTYTDPLLNVDGERRKEEGYTTDILTDYALDWLRQRRAESGDKPFFLILSHKATHAEFVPAPRHRDRYASAAIEYPATMMKTDRNMLALPRWARAQRYGWHGVDYAYHGQFEFDEFYRRYAETLLALDESIGRILDYLEESGLARSTLVIYTSDNGFSLGEHGLIDKRHAYEESIRVPMLAWAPGVIEPGSKIEGMVRNIDIAPTMLDLAGAQAPWKMDGRSVLPLLRGDSAAWSTELLYEYYWEYAFPHTPTVFALRDDRYKFIFYHGIWDTNELFDLETDPDERHNLIAVPAFGDRARSMRDRMWERLEATDGMKIPLRRSTDFQASERRLP
ncbi:MAG: sulfatase family protein [Gemmatimonadaceae bacterium]